MIDIIACEKKPTWCCSALTDLVVGSNSSNHLDLDLDLGTVYIAYL